MTNFERIKGMNVEELAKTIYELDFDNGLCPLYDIYEKGKMTAEVVHTIARNVYWNG